MFAFIRFLKKGKDNSYIGNDYYFKDLNQKHIRFTDGVEGTVVHFYAGGRFDIICNNGEWREGSVEMIGDNFVLI